MTPARPSFRSPDPARPGSDPGPRRGQSFPSLYAPFGRLPLPPGARPRRDPDWAEEEALWQRGYRFVAGIDEVGRGCLAGPVVAAAVILPPGWAPAGLRDSKLLDPVAREQLAAEIRAGAVAWAIGLVDADVIDRTNILEATLMASQLAAARLAVRPDALLLDALRLPGIELPQRSLAGADRLCVSVAAASVVAKTARDAMMADYDRVYPGYGFATHKGYASPEHRVALESLGLCPIHRRTFGTCAVMGEDDENGELDILLRPDDHAGGPVDDQLDLWQGPDMTTGERAGGAGDGG
jgi:ribonuclease HII